MLSYSRQVAVCESVREIVKNAMNLSGDLQIRLKAGSIPGVDSILRAVSVLPSLDTEQKLKGFIADYLLLTLRLVGIQKEVHDLIQLNE